VNVVSHSVHKVDADLIAPKRYLVFHEEVCRIADI
jgi:hypothetical protein